MSTFEPRTDTPAFDELRKALSAFSQEWADAEKVDKVFGYKGTGDEEERLAFLLKRYQVLTAGD